jgi:hypothetical protein
MEPVLHSGEVKEPCGSWGEMRIRICAMRLMELAL